MNATVRPPFRTLAQPEKLYRLELSRKEASGLQLREIHCPYYKTLQLFNRASGEKPA